MRTTSSADRFGTITGSMALAARIATLPGWSYRLPGHVGALVINDASRKRASSTFVAVVNLQIRENPPVSENSVCRKRSGGICDLSRKCK